MWAIDKSFLDVLNYVSTVFDYHIFRPSVIQFAQYDKIGLIPYNSSMLNLDQTNSCKTDVAYICREFTDIDKQAESLAGYDQQYHQLSCGKFRGWSKKLIFGDDFGFHLEVLNQVLDQSASVPSDRYLIIFLMNRNGFCKIHGCSFLPGDLLIAKPGSTVCGIAGPGTHSAVISIKKELFESVMFDSYPSDNEEMNLPESGLFETDKVTAEALRTIVFQAETAWQNHSSAFERIQVRDNIFQSLSSLIAARVAKTFVLEVEPRSIERSHKYKIVQNACDYIQDRSGKNINIVDLCKETRVSRRTLEYSFKDCIGESPVSYLRKIKLNSIRRALLDQANTGRSIGDIAAEWGIWHLSRFAQYYRNQFHELPSETRKKALG